MMNRTTRVLLASLLIGCASIASAQTEWKAKTREGGYTLSSVVFAGKDWVVVGNHGLVMTSSDGDTWLNASTEATRHLGFADLAWSGKTLVAVGYGEGPHFAEGAAIASADGKTWTDTAYSAATLRAVTWGGDQFVAVGDGGGLLTSPDGTKWTIHKPLLEDTCPASPGTEADT